MSRLLFCWELGANLGHLATMALLRDRLRQQGHSFLFAVADLKAAREILGDEAELVQAPAWPDYTHRGSRIEIASFADVLALVGFGDPNALSAVVDGWVSLLRLAGPQIILADHSPAAQLAARALRIPLISLGTGFTQPPLEYSEFPALRADIAPAVPEHALLESARWALARYGASTPPSLPGLFQAQSRFVIGLPELDPYRSFRRELLCAPPNGFARPVPATERSLFVYLGTATPGLQEKVQLLCSLPGRVEFYIRGGDPLLAEFIRLRGKVAHLKPVAIKDALGRVSHVLSAGGAMLTSEALAAGRPHLLLPQHRETALNAMLVTNLGYGSKVDPPAGAPEFYSAVRTFLADEALERRTFDFANLLLDRPLPDVGDQLVAAIAALAAPQDLRLEAASAAPAS